MKLQFSIILMLSFLFLNCDQDNGVHHPTVLPIFKHIDAEFDENEALKTVAFVEQYFRVVGNNGFNESIYFVENILKEQGFVLESAASNSDRLTYRIEKRPLDKPTWEPISASLKLNDGNEILNFDSNRNMIAINSHSTNDTQQFEVVYVGVGRDLTFDTDVTGKVVYAETSVRYLFSEAVLKRGAAGVIAYRMPDYTQPEKNETSIQFSSINYDEEAKSWGILLSYKAKTELERALEEGNNIIDVNIETDIFESEELTIVAELKGNKYPEERFVFSAHIQEPGANDNASGVGALAEVAATSARLLEQGDIDPERTITYLFGDEIVSTNRFIVEDAERAKSIKWGMSLDMVGQNTAITGGSFLIEKMPDPGAIWTRGDEKHSEWGGRPLSKDQMMPHYLNDFVLNRFLEQGQAKNWEVNVNPFEGGSDHVPFLRNDIPGVLLWHFTDQFYHTDNDRIDKVSPQTLKNVGTGALISALILTGDQESAFNLINSELENSAISRLNVEFELSKSALENDGDLDTEVDILNTWSDWYEKSLQSTEDILSDLSFRHVNVIDSSRQAVTTQRDNLIDELKAIAN